MTDSEKAAYTAGIIDGEGCVSLTAVNRPGYSSPLYNFRIKVSMTHEPTVRWLHETWGGNYNSREETRLRKDGGKRRPIYSWYVCGSTALPMLEACLPFMVTKHEQALQAVRWIEVSRNRRRRTPEEHAIRKEILEKISALNHGRVERIYKIPVNSGKPGTEPKPRACIGCGKTILARTRCSACQYKSRIPYFRMYWSKRKESLAVGNPEPSRKAVNG